MGNSEVGHLTIGAGRRLDQDLSRIDRAVADGSFFDNRALRAAFERGENVHLLGLVSYGGVHSHMDHLRALLRFAPEKTWIHAFTDGRDVSPHAAVQDLAELSGERIATVCGRYYAMDRDAHWERTDRALAAMLDGAGSVRGTVPVTEVQRSYERGVTDEFIEPVVLEGRPRIDPERDSVIFFNFRPDRARQLSRRLLERGVDLTTMTLYDGDFDCPVAFGEQVIEDTLAETLVGAGIHQLHVAETEKYAHVTYFLNGGREEPWPGEVRELIPSPRDVGTYDHKPEMSAPEVALQFVKGIDTGDFGFAIVNFANPDMVGHTGVIPAVVEAVEAVDRYLVDVVAAVEREGGICLVTADHGNAEKMLEEDGVSPHTAHTSNPVPLVVTDTDLALRDGGELADLAPTCLELLGLRSPAVMTGRSLVRRQ